MGRGFHCFYYSKLGGEDLKPILFNKNEKKFDTYGLGEIDVLKGNVTRESNALYTFYAEYPAEGPMASVFQQEMKIKVDAGVRTKNQTFEISRIVKDSSNIIKIYGYHISHKTEYMAIANGVSVNGTAQEALTAWANNLIGDVRFDVWSDINTVGKTTFTVDKFENARQALGGVEGSILDIWGGEYEFDNTTIRLHKQLGRRAPTVLEYGRNILSAESDESIESAYTSVYPFATYTPEGDSGQKDPVTVTIPEKYVDSKYISMYANRRIKVVDFSSKFKDKDIPTPEKLKNFASNYMTKNKIGAPKINTKIDYVDLASTLDYQGRKVIEELELCDIVPIYYPSIGITEDDAKVTKIVYDFINERNESVEFGLIGTSIRSAMTSNVSERLDTLEGRQQALESDLPAYLLNAQGNKIWYDTPDNTKEHKIGDTWFEKNGLYERMYIWNGEMWEKIIDTEDVSRLKSEFDAEVEKITKSLSDQDKKAEEALKASGANTSVLAEVKQTLQQFDTDFASIRQNVEVNKKSVEDNLRGITRRFEELTTATDSKLAEYAQTVDGRFTRLANQYADKTEFQKVQETSKLYERILGSTENDLTTKVSRLVMSNQLFQTEVSKFSLLGPNLIQNSCDPINTDSWGYWRPEEKPVVTISRHPFYFNGQKNLFYLSNKTNATVPVTSNRFKVKRNTLYTLTLKGFYSASTKSITIYFLGRKKDDTEIYTVVKQLDKNAVFSDSQIIEKSYTFNSGEVDEAYIRLDNNGTTNEYGALFYFTEVDLYEGDVKRSWQAPPSDINILSTKVTQLLGSWSVKNLNSNGDIVSQINATGSDVRIQGESIHLNGKTLIDKAVIDGAAIKEMSADKITAGTLNAAKVKLINLDASSITTGTLDGAKANIININASSVKSGTFTGLTYRGGRMEALNGAMNINLNEADISFNKNAVINFNNKNNAIVRRKGAYTAFAHFADVEARDGDGGSLYAGFGVTSSNDGIKSDSGGRFSGIRCFRNGLQNGTSHTATIDRVEIYGDNIIFKDDFNIGRGFYFRPDLTKAYFNLNEMLAQFNHNFKHIINIIGGSHAIKTYDSYEIYRDFK